LPGNSASCSHTPASSICWSGHIDHTGQSVHFRQDHRRSRLRSWERIFRTRHRGRDRPSCRFLTLIIFGTMFIRTTLTAGCLKRPDQSQGASSGPQPVADVGRQYCRAASGRRAIDRRPRHMGFSMAAIATFGAITATGLGVVHTRRILGSIGFFGRAANKLACRAGREVLIISSVPRLARGRRRQATAASPHRPIGTATLHCIVSGFSLRSEGLA
jgi:hypothetical protein